MAAPAQAPPARGPPSLDDEGLESLVSERDSWVCGFTSEICLSIVVLGEYRRGPV